MKIFFSFLILCFALSNLFAANVMLMEMSNDGLTEKGFRDGILFEKPNTRFYTFGANGNPELLKMQIKASFAYKPALFFTKNLNSVKILSKELNNKYPLVFVMIKDPVTNKIIASRKSPEVEITGVTTKIPLLQQIKVMKKIKPFKKLAIISKQNNLIRNIEQIKHFEKFFKFQSIIINYENIENLYDELFYRKPDFLYIPSNSKINPEEIQLINRLKIPSMVENSELVKKGMLLSLVIDDYKAGRLAAKQAVSILNGKLASKIPVSEIQHFMVAVNIKTAKKINVQIPLSLLVIADKIYK